MKRFVLFATLSGCSWLVSRPPPPTRCASAAPAIYDTMQVAGGAVLTLWALGEAEDTQADTFGTVAAVTAGVTAAFAASASYGYRNARMCLERRPPPPPPPLEVEQTIDVTDEQIDIHTTIRR